MWDEHELDVQVRLEVSENLTFLLIFQTIFLQKFRNSYKNLFLQKFQENRDFKKDLLMVVKAENQSKRHLGDSEQDGHFHFHRVQEGQLVRLRQIPDRVHADRVGRALGNKYFSQYILPMLQIIPIFL